MSIRNTFFLLACFFSVSIMPAFNQAKIEDHKLILENQEDYNWWFGVINHGEQMPFYGEYSADIYGDNYGNQIVPFLIAKDGQYIWSEEPLKVDYKNGTLHVKSHGGEIFHSSEATSLKEAYKAASHKFFPPSGKLPDLSLFEAPQYNTWIELMYDQNQKDIMDYAKAILDNGFPPGVIMIDDNWQIDYGNWDFKPDQFPDPKAMIDSLHEMGFKVMLWICPFVSPDSRIYRKLRDEGLLLKEKNGNAAILRWWNGASGLLDFTHPDAVKWFEEQMDYLVEEYGADGFKLDAGDTRYYTDLVAHKDVTPNEHTRLYGEFGLKYPLNEYRANYKLGNQPLVERLRDKGHSWDDLQKLIPHILLQGIAGYAFTCPDMIGGGEYTAFLNNDRLDQKLIVRSAQVHALMPMMQFSVAPWRVLDTEHLAAVKKAVEIRQQHKDLIIDLAKSSAYNGEPIVRSMEYVFPHQGYAKVKDQFLLGDDILVAPLIENGTSQRQVIIPKGKWEDSKGNKINGPKTLTIDVALDELPYYKRIK